MPSAADRWNGWRGVCLIAVTYVYFLIFAQFAFLKRLGELAIAEDHLKVVMAAMAAGGISFSLLASRKCDPISPRVRLLCGFALCAAAAMLSLLPLGLTASVGVSLLIGCGLGIVTLTLVSRLDLWIGNGEVLFKVGLGTGLGYLLCNVPALFTATPQAQAITSASLCLLGILAAARSTPHSHRAQAAHPATTATFVTTLAAFTALIWLDSAAFYIIQNTPSLKAGTWQGTLHLWGDGTLHLVAALVCAWLLRRRGLNTVLATAILCLASACLLLLDRQRVVLASLFYPVGVSLYSVALVAYPSLLLSGPLPERAKRAGLIYAIAGWGGSAMGIGMAQHLGRVPVLFVAGACALVLGPQLPGFLRRHGRETAVLGVVMLLACLVSFALPDVAPKTTQDSAVERGRAIYIAEGCINCHSQYVRPGTADVQMWGPVQTVEELRAQRPPLIGNRRQGPDLSQVGGRRSPLWLKAHLYNPRELSYGSFMPAYASLFQNGDSRGDDLVAYLSSLRTSGTQAHQAQELRWRPVASGSSSPSEAEGARLFVDECATCHSENGADRLRWYTHFKHLPANLLPAPRHNAQPQSDPARVARIIKFGIPGTDMPGHEYFTDQQVLALVAWLQAAESLDVQSQTRPEDEPVTTWRRSSQ